MGGINPFATRIWREFGQILPLDGLQSSLFRDIIIRINQSHTFVIFKGIKYINREMTGDMYVKVKLVVPKKLNHRQRELLHEFDQLEDKSGSIWDKLKKAFK